MVTTVSPLRPRVAHLIHADAAGGGPQILLDHLAHTRDRFTLSAIYGGNGRVAAACEVGGIPHHKLPLDRPWKWLAGLPMLVHLLVRDKPDLLVLHGQWGATIGGVAGRLAGVKTIVYLTVWPAFYGATDAYRAARNDCCERLACRLAHRVVTLSAGNYYQYLIRGMVRPGCFVQLSHGIDLARVPTTDDTAAVRRSLGGGPAACHVISVGRLVAQKRVDWLLQSWKRVQAAEPSARLWIVGSGDEETSLKRLTHDLGIESTCSFLGNRPNGITYLAAADIVAMTSLFEAPGCVPLEALACGRPIVASRVDGIMDSVEDGTTGFLVPPGNSERFADRLLELIRNPALRQRMGQASRDAVQQFAMPDVMARFVTVMSQWHAERNRRPESLAP